MADFKWLTSAFLTVLLTLGCNSPERTSFQEEWKKPTLVARLAAIEEWSPKYDAEGFTAYDQLLGMGDSAFPALIAGITDTTETRLTIAPGFDSVTVGELAFLILMRITETSFNDYEGHGVRRGAAVNSGFAVVFEGPAGRQKLQGELARRYLQD